MLKFHSSMLCTSRIHPFSLGNYLRTSLIIGNFMIIRVTRYTSIFQNSIEEETFAVGFVTIW